MVTVFVGDENCIEFVDILTDGSQPLPGLQATEARIDKNAGAIGSDERGVPRTTGR